MKLPAILKRLREKNPSTAGAILAVFAKKVAASREPWALRAATELEGLAYAAAGRAGVELPSERAHASRLVPSAKAKAIIAHKAAKAKKAK